MRDSEWGVELMKSGDSQNFSLIGIVWETTRKKDSNSLGTHICDVECQKDLCAVRVPNNKTLCEGVLQLIWDVNF